MSGLQYGYEYHSENEREPRHVWTAVGASGGVHIWATEKSDDMVRSFGGRFYGGIECHWRKPRYDTAGPDHDNCWLLNGPCWHDGSSLYFDENIEPMLGSIRGADVPDSIHEYLKSELFDWYYSKIDRSVEADLCCP